MNISSEKQQSGNVKAKKLDVTSKNNNIDFKITLLYSQYIVQGRKEK